MASQKLDALKTTVSNLHEVPYCTGAVPLVGVTSTLFYQSEDQKARVIDFASVTDDQLEALTNACDQLRSAATRRTFWTSRIGRRERWMLENLRRISSLSGWELSTQFATPCFMDAVRRGLFVSSSISSMCMVLAHSSRLMSTPHAVRICLDPL
ncbi:unnamed protein product [Cyclocybe aegerita]|uniref:Uncharacterized protein n=1 Tax=Cyclocybe aegerita TaxID=1973307 RepID=A0A8S0XSG5_CYCAE|nr:unnamed protein product [Cyclocybe aegerita]